MKTEGRLWPQHLAGRWVGGGDPGLASRLAPSWIKRCLFVTASGAGSRHRAVLPRRWAALPPPRHGVPPLVLVARDFATLFWLAVAAHRRSGSSVSASLHKWPASTISTLSMVLPEIRPVMVCSSHSRFQLQEALLSPSCPNYCRPRDCRLTWRTAPPRPRPDVARPVEGPPQGSWPVLHTPSLRKRLRRPRPARRGRLVPAGLSGRPWQMIDFLIAPLPGGERLRPVTTCWWSGLPGSAARWVPNRYSKTGAIGW